MTGKTIRSFDGKPSTPTPLPAETPFSIPVPADPRELPCGFAYKESTRMICGQPKQAWPHYPGASGHHAYKPNERRVGKPDRRALAARQDEPSPALRSEFEKVAGEAHAYLHGRSGARFSDCQNDPCPSRRALAANPPQTREAEAFAAGRLTGFEEGIEAATCKRGHIESPFPFARTPEAQRDAEPPDTLLDDIAASLERQVGLTAINFGRDVWRDRDPLLARAVDALAELRKKP